MNKNITVENLVKLYDADKTVQKDNFTNQLKIEGYIPYERKIAVAEAILNASLDTIDGMVKVNSPKKYFFYCLGVINLYTNIIITLNSKEDDDPIVIANLMYSEFNALNSRGLFEFIFSKIPDKEFTEFNTILDMVTNDYVENNCSFHGYSDNLINSLIKITSAISELSSKEIETEDQNE